MSNSIGSAPIRLADVAKQASVSTATVSRVLNGNPGVSEQSKNAVLAALDLLGYERPARLTTKSAGLVGLVLPELSNPVFPAFAQAISTSLAQRGYTPLLCTQSPGGNTEVQILDTLQEHRLDGIIFVSGLHADVTANKDRYLQLMRSGMPIVLINGYSLELDAPSVSTDDDDAITQAYNHLRTLGHEKIGMAMGPKRFVPALRKAVAFTRLIGADSLDDVHIVYSLFTVEGGQQAAGKLIDSGHTAIICGSDMMALGAIRAARARGLHVPRDISVVGFDDSPMVAFTNPPLTTLRQRTGEVCQTAVSTLLTEINGNEIPRGEMLIQADLIVRQTTGSAPTT